MATAATADSLESQPVHTQQVQIISAWPGGWGVDMAPAATADSLESQPVHTQQVQIISAWPGGWGVDMAAATADSLESQPVHTQQVQIISAWPGARWTWLLLLLLILWSHNLCTHNRYKSSLHGLGGDGHGCCCC